VIVDGITIPPNATGIIGNATAAAPSADGFLTLYAASETVVPAVSNLNSNPAMWPGQIFAWCC
jgi:hypothetical protein